MTPRYPTQEEIEARIMSMVFDPEDEDEDEVDDSQEDDDDFVPPAEPKK